MDTPEKNKIGTPLSKFEDSPVFNYINSLSPIKPVKSQHITQTFSSLSFASLPSVFTSPHVNPNKESRFLRRYSISDLSKPALSSENPGKDCAAEEDNIIYNNTLLAQNEDSSVLTVNAGVSSVDQLDYDCLSTPQPRGPEEDFGSELVNPSDPVDHGCEEISAEKGLLESETTRYHELCLSDHRKDGAVCDWESLISDSADILIFDSPNSSEAFRGLVHNSIEPVVRLCATKIAGQGNVNSDHQQHQQAREEFYHLTEDGSQLTDFEPIQDMFYNDDLNLSERKKKESEAHVAFSCKSVLSLHRGIRRRCLDFEMAGGRRRVIEEEGQNSNSDSKITAESNRLGSSLRRLLPGIGLHLNALAATSKDSNNNNNNKISNSEDLSAAIRIRNISIGQEPLLDKSLDSNSNENGVQVLQDSGGSLAAEELNQNSPKKKRRKMENAGEPEGCKRCNCKKSKCLKLYCECFAAGVYCIEPCSCQECFNKPIHEDTVLSTRKQIESRNPLAFAPKVIRNSESVPEYGQHQDESSKTPASARHKRGCNCKKSSCLKKYCECYQGGVGCSVNCRCEGCKNAFGRKDGSSTLIDVEPDHDEEEHETSEKSFAEKTSLTIEEPNPTSALPITPLQMPRPLMVPMVPFSSKGKPPRSSFITVGLSSSGLYGPKQSSRPSILRSQPSKFGKLTETAEPDGSEILPEILLEDRSPVTGIKSRSPNSKRISPPQCLFGSPGRRSGRKLILQSIPSFPSLTPHE